MSRSSNGCVTERNCLPSNRSYVLKRIRDVLIEFTVNTNLPFRTAKSFQLLEIWINDRWSRSRFSHSRGIMQDSCCLNAIRASPRSRQLTAIKPQDHSQKVQFSTHCIYSMANSKLITTVNIDQDCAQGSVSDSHPRCYTTAVLWGVVIISNCVNLWLPPWKFKRLQTTLRPSKPTARQYVVVSEQETEHRSMLDVNKAELNILPGDSLVNRCLVYIGEA